MRSLIVLLALVVYAVSAAETIRLNLPCAFHVRVKLAANTDPNYVYDTYWMLKGDDVAYVREEIHSPGRFVLKMYYYDFDAQDGSYYRMSNITDECKIDRVWPVDVFTNFTYTSYTTGVDCPNGEYSCTKYCNRMSQYSEVCIIVDEMGRYVSYNGEMNYTYMDDVPSHDMFDGECEGYQYSAEDYCPKKLSFNMNCTGHLVETEGFIVYDTYWMLNGTDIVYLRETFESRSSGEIMTNVYRVDTLDEDGIFLVWTNSTEISLDYFPLTKKEFESYGYITEFWYYGEPEQVSCPGDDTKVCMKYCSSPSNCATVDAYGRMITLGDDRHYFAFEYPEGDATVDMFVVQINGTTYEAIDFCLEPSSSSSSSQASSTVNPSSTVTPSSTHTQSVVSAACLQKAFGAIVVAAMVAMLL